MITYPYLSILRIRLSISSANPFTKSKLPMILQKFKKIEILGSFNTVDQKEEYKELPKYNVLINFQTKLTNPIVFFYTQWIFQRPNPKL